MRLLVIEDYAPLRQSLVQGLTEADFAVDATGDGKEGLWYAKDEAYDVVILDLMLPGLDGLSILKLMREAGKKCPVLILTAKDKVEDRVQGLNMGADDYLIKPFAFEELLARVNTLIRRKYEIHTSVVTVGGLCIDFQARRVHFNNAPIELTAREFSVIEVLALRAGQVVSRSDISEHIYGFDAEPNSNAIDVHVVQLRRKIDTAGGGSLIHTRRGMGYVLEDNASCGH